MTENPWTVGEVAGLARVTVRTLHHYDAIGLLKPSARAESGYRLYTRSDLERLQQIRLYRELGLGLDAIRQVLDATDFDRAAALRAHRETLARRLEETQALIHTVDRTLEALDTGETMEPEDLFDGFDPEEHAPEAEQRWGDTRAWRQSQRRTRTYGPREWTAIKEEARAINEGLAALLAAGTPPDDSAAKALAEQHRLHITRWFYDCAPELHAEVARLYTEDPRFEANYEKVATGLAAYVRAAVEANAADR